MRRLTRMRCARVNNVHSNLMKFTGAHAYVIFLCIQKDLARGEYWNSNENAASFPNLTERDVSIHDKWYIGRMEMDSSWGTTNYDCINPGWRWSGFHYKRKFRGPCMQVSLRMSSEIPRAVNNSLSRGNLWRWKKSINWNSIQFATLAMQPRKTFHNIPVGPKTTNICSICYFLFGLRGVLFDEIGLLGEMFPRYLSIIRVSQTWKWLISMRHTLKGRKLNLSHLLSRCVQFGCETSACVTLWKEGSWIFLTCSADAYNSDVRRGMSSKRLRICSHISFSHACWHHSLVQKFHRKWQWQTCAALVWASLERKPPRRYLRKRSRNNLENSS